MPRAVWKGAIAFSLVNIPVALYPASGANELDLHLLDRRDFAAARACISWYRSNAATTGPR
ncbi:MAG: hypothetical protein WAZ34_05795 [Rhodocyclaceae bacterium]